jgi:hypothetical protein
MVTKVNCKALWLSVLFFAALAFPATAATLTVQEPVSGQLLGQIVNPGFVVLCDGPVNSDSTGCTQPSAGSDTLVFQNVFNSAGAPVDTNMLFCSDIADGSDPGDISIAGCTLIRGTPTFLAIPEANFEQGQELTVYTPTANQAGGGTGNTYNLISDTSQVPEPGSLVLIGSGLVALAYRLRSRIR